MSNLKTFQAFMKFFRVLAIIGFVCFIIAFVGLVAVFFASLSPDLVAEINQILIESQMEPFGDNIQPLLLTTIITVLGAGIATFMSMRYLKHEIKQGTPFNTDNAKELFVVSLVSIITPIVATIINSIIIACYGTTMLDQTSMINDSLLGSGLLLLAGSFAFKYGAELQEKAKNNE